MNPSKARKSHLLRIACWLVLGFACGMLLPHVAKRGSDSPDTAAPGHQARSENGGDGPSSGSHRRIRAEPEERRVTPEQLAKLATQGGRLPGLDWIVSTLHQPSKAYPTNSGTPESFIDKHLQETFKPLEFNAQEKERLSQLLWDAIHRLIDLEATSLPIRETGQGKIILDFDDLADRRQAIMDELRAGIRQSLGQRALDDLTILAGLDEFVGSGYKSNNVEISVERHDATLKTWIFIPGPVGREGSVTTSPDTMPYRDLLENTLKQAASGRFSQLSDRLPESLTPPP